jgi:hypothetical protein
VSAQPGAWQNARIICASPPLVKHLGRRSASAPSHAEAEAAYGLLDESADSSARGDIVRQLLDVKLLILITPCTTSPIDITPKTPYGPNM